MRNTSGPGCPAEEGGFNAKSPVSCGLVLLSLHKPYRGDSTVITGRISRLGILFPMREANLTGTTRQKLPGAAVQAVQA
jgi:hypothetical protein